MNNLIVTSQQFNGVDRTTTYYPYFDGRLLGRYCCKTTFYFQKGSQISNNLSISGNVISNITCNSTESFITDDGFQIGEQIVLPGSASNTSSYTITALTDTTITVSVGLTTETPTSYIYVSTLITGLDWLYNLLPVTASNPSFYSFTDPLFQQKYIVSGISATNTTPIYFNIGSSSYAWVTDTMSGNNSQASIVGNGISSTGNTANAYQQSFTITHYFFISTISGNQLRNFQQGNTPAIYPLTYAYGINAYYIGGTPVIVDSLTGLAPNGASVWANQNNASTQPEFSFGSIVYIDNATGNILNSLDFSKNNLVTILVNSKSGLFVAGATVILEYIYISTSTTDYQKTPTTWRQNFMNDRCVTTIGASAANGEFSGTVYSVIQNVVCTVVSPNVMAVNCSIQYSASLQKFLISKQASNRNYSLLVDVQI